MKFTSDQIGLILFGNIQNQTHKRERLRGFAKFLVGRFWRVIPGRIAKLKSDKKGILFFSTEKFFNLHAFHDFRLYCYKENIPGSVVLDLRHEEYVLILSIFLPDSLRPILFSYVYRRIQGRLDGVPFSCFVCNQPEIVNHLIAFYFRDKGVMTVTMQHGIYMPKFYQPLYYERHLADLILVWGEVYKSCYQQHDINPDRLAVSSPPLIMRRRAKRETSPRGMRPVFLGQQLFKIHDDVFRPYNSFVESLIRYWNRFGVRLHYKPHPREDVSKSIDRRLAHELVIESRTSVSSQFFERFDVAYSVNSTSLFHALCADAICFQADLKLDDLPNEWFDMHSSIVRIAKDQIDDHLKLPGAERSRFIDPAFLNLIEDPQRFNSDLLLSRIQ